MVAGEREAISEGTRRCRRLLSGYSVVDEIVAREYAIALQIFNDTVVYRRRQNTPVGWAPMNSALAVISVTSVTQRAPHPNAAKLFVDFDVGPEGQAIERDNHSSCHLHGTGENRGGLAELDANLWRALSLRIARDPATPVSCSYWNWKRVCRSAKHSILNFANTTFRPSHAKELVRMPQFHSKPDWLAKKQAKLLVLFGANPIPTYPMFHSPATSRGPRRTNVFSTWPSRSWTSVGPICCLQEPPADRVAALRLAFLDSYRDAEFLAEADKEQLGVDPVTGEQLQDLLKRTYGAPEAVIDG